MAFEKLFSEFPVIETDRLRLRKLTQKDSKIMYRYLSDHKSSKYMPYTPYSELKQVENLIDTILENIDERRNIRWGIVEKNKDRLIGDCGYYQLDENNMIAKSSYRLDPLHWGKGYMTEAIKALVDFTFSNTEINRIEASAISYNTGSIRVLQKAGFIREGIKYQGFRKDNIFYDLVLFALIRSY